MNSVIKNAMKDFNDFKHPKENIYTIKDYCDEWKQPKAILVITADYECIDQDDRIKCNINYKDQFFGSYKFNRWLRRYDFFFEWLDGKTGYIYLKIMFD